MASSIEVFQHLALSPGSSLAHSALCIARLQYPELDLSRYLDWFEGHGARLNKGIGVDATLEDRLRVVNTHLYHQSGFHPNLEDYYDPRNSFLNDVIERRMGIPISLSVVYMELAAHLGLDLKGVGFPGHFLVRVRSGLFVDPFDYGKILEHEDCRRRFHEMAGESLPFREEYLKPASKVEVLARMLGNLKGIYLQQEKLHRSIEILNWILAIEPHIPLHYRDRGILLARVGCSQPAVKDLETYLEYVTHDGERGRIKKLISGLRGQSPTIH